MRKTNSKAEVTLADRFTVEKVSSLVTHLEFLSQKDMCATMLRFEEHAESPEFKGKVFTLGQYREWYSRTTGAFTYYTDWEGFNVPSSSFRPFIEGLFDPLTKEEQEVVDLFKDRKDDFYVIATCRDVESAYEHEICHAMYRTIPEYGEEVRMLLAEFHLVPLCEYLLKIGYDSSVLDDECNAYICDDALHLVGENVEFPYEAVKRFKDLKEKYKTNLEDY